MAAGAGVVVAVAVFAVPVVVGVFSGVNMRSLTARFDTVLIGVAPSTKSVA